MSLPDEGARTVRRVALLMWGDVIEDFLAPLGWSLDDFLGKMSGGWLFGYAEALRRHGIDCTLFVFSSDARAPMATQHAPTGMPVRVLRAPTRYRALRALVRSPYRWLADGASPAVPRPWPLGAIAARALDALPYLATPVDALATAIAHERCDAILCQEYEEARFDAAIATGARLGIPVFATFQGGRARRSRREAAIRPHSIAQARALFIGSAREAARVRATYGVDEPGGTPLVAVLNPIDESTWYPERLPETRRSLGIPADRILVAWHGRVAREQKGTDILLAAWDRAADRTTVPLHLLLVGAGEDSDDLARRLSMRTRRDDVTWVDSYIADRGAMRRYLSAADCHVLPSRHEGLSVAPLEAMACGLPVIASDVDGIADIAPRGEADGIVTVAPGDAEALACAMLRVTGDAALRARLAAAARARSLGAFGMDAVGAVLAQVLRAP